MKYNNVSLPYPVLGINDDVYPLLDEHCIVVAEPIKTATEFKFIIDVTQHNDEISSLISRGKAEYACEITCSDTYLRKCIHSSEAHFEITIPRRDVKGRINFQCFIAAKTAIKGYTNKDFNEDYYGFSFDIEIGDMLVLFPLISYNTNIKFDKLYAAGSFMQIVEAADNVESTWFDLDEDKIMIQMPRPLFLQYQRIGSQFPEIIHSSIVHNALVYALWHLEDYKDKGKLWVDSLLLRLNEAEFSKFDLTDMSQVYKVADILLQNPYKRLLDSLEKLNETLINNQEE